MIAQKVFKAVYLASPFRQSQNNFFGVSNMCSIRKIMRFITEIVRIEIVRASNRVQGEVKFTVSTPISQPHRIKIELLS